MGSLYTGMFIPFLYSFSRFFFLSGRGAGEQELTESQIIFPTVTKVGIASARSRTGATFVVARYDVCQLLGKYPCNERKGNIFQGRRWPDDGSGKGGGGQGGQGYQGHQGFQGYGGYGGYVNNGGYQGFQGYGGYGGGGGYGGFRGYQGHHEDHGQHSHRDTNAKVGMMNKVLKNIGIDRHAQASGSEVKGILNMDPEGAKGQVVEVKQFMLLAKDGAVKLKELVDVVRKK